MRRDIDQETVRHMADSIVDNLAHLAPPLINPIIVRKCGEQFEIVKVCHRYLAMRQAGQTSIACNVVSMTEQQAQMFWIAQKLTRVPLSKSDRAERESKHAALMTNRGEL